jgi:hypothetical protein
VRFTITHHGVPIGTVKFDPSKPTVGLPVRPMPAYAAVREIVRAATTALAGIEPGQPAGKSIPQRWNVVRNWVSSLSCVMQPARTLR